MKHLTTFILLLTLLTTTAAGSYKPIVSESSTWDIVGIGYGIYHQSRVNKYEKVKIQEDTVINDIIYHSVYASVDSLSTLWEPIAFIREDTLQKKVWLRTLDGNEGLCYDFDLSMGKTITIQNSFVEVYYTVTGIDSIRLGAQWHKSYTLRSMMGYDEVWIEGIGSTYGLMYSGYTSAYTGGAHALLAYSNDSVTYTGKTFIPAYFSKLSPLITTQTIDTAPLGIEYHYPIKTIETEVFIKDSIVWSLAFGTLPNGLVLNEQTGLISGTPTQAGTFELCIQVKNNAYFTDYIETSIVVDNSAETTANDTPQKLILFPNPVKDQMYIQTTKEITKVDIYDATGSVVLRCLEVKNNVIDLSHLKKGFYLILVDIDGKVFKQSFVIQ